MSSPWQCFEVLSVEGRGWIALFFPHLQGSQLGGHLFLGTLVEHFHGFLVSEIFTFTEVTA